MRILITGITGLLGWTLQRLVTDEAKIFGIYYPKRVLEIPLMAKVCAANVADKMEMKNVFNWARPDVVIHTAAIGSVDYAEKNREHTKEINFGGTRIIADLCEEWKSHLVYISSNAVFNGLSPFYSENDEVDPINYYGQLKVEAEEVVMRTNTSWTIIRPILMYGWPYPGERGNLVTTWVASLRRGEPINVVDNVWSKPLYSEMCAEVVLTVIEKKAKGIFHVAGGDHVSLYDFAIITAEVFGLDSSLINPVPDTFFGELVPRPKDTSFNTEKMEHELGVTPVLLREGLKKMKETEGTRNHAR
jgi:dTDP-4-dehydrorhamnose reductase